MAGLTLTFWPNPVYRNHSAETRWYFNVVLREVEAQHVQVLRYHGEWYDIAGRRLDHKEEPLNIRLTPLQHISYPDLWVTSAIPQFRYQLTVVGRDTQGREVTGDGMLLCQ